MKRILVAIVLAEWRLRLMRGTRGNFTPHGKGAIGRSRMPLTTVLRRLRFQHRSIVERGAGWKANEH